MVRLARFRHGMWQMFLRSWEHERLCHLKFQPALRYHTDRTY